MEYRIIHEDSQIIVALKPPGMPSQSDPSGDEDLLSLLLIHLKKEYPKAQNPYLGLIHRLDRPVGGLMVFAKTKEANAFISEEIRNRKVEKEYLAVVCGEAKEEENLVNYLQRNSRTNTSRVVEAETKGAKKAILSYRRLGFVEDEKEGILSLIRIKLETGRHHQIRVQLAGAGLAIWGDTKYNKDFLRRKGWSSIALWAESLSFMHPKHKEKASFRVKPADIFPFELFSF